MANTACCLYVNVMKAITQTSIRKSNMNKQENL